MIVRWLREPLVHFVAIGTLLFIVFEWRGAGPASRRIVITPGQVEALAAGFARTWQREPTADELKGLVDEHVRDEIATREAMASIRSPSWAWPEPSSCSLRSRPDMSCR
jgi:hypothetical protein